MKKQVSDQETDVGSRTCTPVVQWEERQWQKRDSLFNPLNVELNPICHLLALLGVHHFLHVSRIRVKRIFENIDDVIGTVIRPQVGTSRSRSSIPGTERCSCLLHSAQTGSGAQPPYTMVTKDSFPGGWSDRAVTLISF